MDLDAGDCAVLWGKVLERAILDEIGLLNKREKRETYTPNYFTKGVDFPHIIQMFDLNVEWMRKKCLQHIADGLEKKRNTPQGKRFVYKVCLDVSITARAENSASTKHRKKEAAHERRSL